MLRLVSSYKFPRSIKQMTRSQKETLIQNTQSLSEFTHL